MLLKKDQVRGVQVPGRGEEERQKKRVVFFLINFIRVHLLYNGVLISTIQQSESTLCIHISPHFGGLLSHLEY